MYSCSCFIDYLLITHDHWDHLDYYAVLNERFPGINLAILENGQYNEDWKYIHTLPKYLGQIARDLNVEKVLTVHHSKYALARPPWNEPLKNVIDLAKKGLLDVLMPMIGEVVRWN